MVEDRVRVEEAGKGIDDVASFFLLLSGSALIIERVGLSRSRGLKPRGVDNLAHRSALSVFIRWGSTVAYRKRYTVTYQNLRIKNQVITFQISDINIHTERCTYLRGSPIEYVTL